MGVYETMHPAYVPTVEVLRLGVSKDGIGFPTFTKLDASLVQTIVVDAPYLPPCRFAEIAT